MTTPASETGGSPRARAALVDAWRRARTLFHFPSVRDPELGPVEEGARFDLTSGRARLDPARCEELAERSGASLEEAALALATRALARYMIYPRNLANLLFLLRVSRDFLREGEDEALADVAALAYADLAAAEGAARREDLERPARLGLEALAAVRGEETLGGRATRLAAERLAGRRAVGGEGPARALALANSLDLARPARDLDAVRAGALAWMEAVRSVGADLLGAADEARESRPPPPGAAAGGSSSIAAEVRAAPKAAIDQALSELARRLTRGEYRRIAEMTEQLRDPAPGESVRGAASGTLGIGTSRGELMVRRELVDYYRRLAEQHPLAVRPRIEPTERLFRAFGSTERFRVGSDPGLLVPASSGGRLLLGLTRKAKITYSPRLARNEQRLAALICIDSSASMIDPDERKSMMVLAAFCAALSYDRVGARLGVVNFSRESFHLPFTRRLEDVLAALVIYQGGGTRLDLELIASMLGLEERRESARRAARATRDDAGAGAASSRAARERDAPVDERGGGVPHPEGSLSREERDLREVLGLSREASRRRGGLRAGGEAGTTHDERVDLLLFTDLAVENLEELSALVDAHDELGRVIVVTHEERADAPLSPRMAVFDRVAESEDLVRVAISEVQQNLVSARAPSAPGSTR